MSARISRCGAIAGLVTLFVRFASRHCGTWPRKVFWRWTKGLSILYTTVYGYVSGFDCLEDDCVCLTQTRVRNYVMYVDNRTSSGVVHLSGLVRPKQVVLPQA